MRYRHKNLNFPLFSLYTLCPTLSESEIDTATNFSKTLSFDRSIDRSDWRTANQKQDSSKSNWSCRSRISISRVNFRANNLGSINSSLKTYCSWWKWRISSRQCRETRTYRRAWSRSRPFNSSGVHTHQMPHLLNLLRPLSVSANAPRSTNVPVPTGQHIPFVHASRDRDSWHR